MAVRARGASIPPDRWIRFRLLKYCCRIWDRSRRQFPRERRLRPIVPLVFYQGPGHWRHATEFAELFADSVRDWPWVPRFAHLLIDHKTATPHANSVNSCVRRCRDREVIW